MEKYRFKIDKLIRDKLPAIMHAKNITASTRVMEPEEFMVRLKDKLLEETKEVIQATTQEEIKEELADLLEMIFTFCKAWDLPFETVMEACIQKREEKGGFDDRIYSSFVEMEPDNPKLAYYLAKPDHYPRIDS